MKRLFLFFVAAVLVLSAGCFQLNLPEVQGKKTAQYTLDLPADFKKPEISLAIAEFVSETSAKYKMVSRKGTEVFVDPFAKWSSTPSVMITSAFRKLFGCDDSDNDEAIYLLQGDIFLFERNLNRNTADLKIQYVLTERESGKNVWKKELSTSVPLTGDTPEAFALAMSKAVVIQAEAVRTDISKLNAGK